MRVLFQKIFQDSAYVCTKMFTKMILPFFRLFTPIQPKVIRCIPSVKEVPLEPLETPQMEVNTFYHLKSGQKLLLPPKEANYSNIYN